MHYLFIWCNWIKYSINRTKVYAAKMEEHKTKPSKCKDYTRQQLKHAFKEVKMLHIHHKSRKFSLLNQLEICRLKNSSALLNPSQFIPATKPVHKLTLLFGVGLLDTIHSHILECEIRKGNAKIAYKYTERCYLL